MSLDQSADADTPKRTRVPWLQSIKPFQLGYLQEARGASCCETGCEQLTGLLYRQATIERKANMSVSGETLGAMLINWTS